MKENPIHQLRTALGNLLDGAAFDYNEGLTRQLVAQGQKALRDTLPAVAHERPVGIFHYDPEAKAFVQADEDQAKDTRGELRPGYEYLFKHPRELASA